MKLKLYSLTALLLCAAILFSGCGFIIINHKGEASGESGNDTQSYDTTGSVTTSPGYTKVETEDDYDKCKAEVNSLPDGDFGGVSIIIASPAGEAIAPQSIDSLYDAAIVKRNRLVEEKYNTSIVSVTATAEEIIDQAKKAEYSGTQYADLICIPMNQIGSFASKGLLMSMNSLPLTDYSSDGYDSLANSQSAAGYTAYAVTGNANKSLEYMYGVYFNKDLAKSLGIESPYQAVYNNYWTWDTFKAYTKTALDAGYGGFTSYCTYSEFSGIVMASTGYTFADTGFGMIPQRNEPADILYYACDLFREMLSDGSYSGTVAGGPYAESLDEFKAGKTLFCIGTVGMSGMLGSMSDQWGILPIPKYSQEQPYYYTHIDSSMPVFAVLKSSNSIENTSLALKALNTASGYYFREGYYNHLLLNSICDTDTLSMLDRIYDGAILDFAYLFGNEYENIAAGTYDALFSALSGKATLDRAYSSTAAVFSRTANRLFAMHN